MQKIILLEIISGFGMDARYKISIQKNKWHFNTLSRNVESKFLNIIYICILKNQYARNECNRNWSTSL